MHAFICRYICIYIYIVYHIYIHTCIYKYVCVCEYVHPFGQDRRGPDGNDGNDPGACGQLVAVEAGEDGQLVEAVEAVEDGETSIHDSDSELWMGEVIPGPGCLDDGEDSQVAPMVKVESDAEDLKPVEDVVASLPD